MQCKSKDLSRRGLKQQIRPRGGDLFRQWAAIGSKLLVDETTQIGTQPPGPGQQNMRTRQRSDASLNRVGVLFNGGRVSEPDD